MEDIYEHEAEGYEQRWEAYLNHTHGKFLDSIETDEEDILLDISGGTGLLAREIVDEGYPFSKLVVNDPSESMLEFAKDRLSDDERVEFLNSMAEDVETKYSFDRIFCLNAFHFYKHQENALQNMNGLLGSGGTLYFLDWNREGLFRIVNRCIDLGTSEHIDTKSLPELLEMLKKANFQIKDTESWGWRYWKFFFVKAKKL